MTSQTGANYITLAEAKDQLAIDQGLAAWDDRIEMLIGSAIDWAENYTQRSLGELLELDSPTDSSAVPLPNPIDSPRRGFRWWPPSDDLSGGFDWALESIDWPPPQWQWYWQKNPVQQDDSRTLRRDVKAAILLKIESLFDRNVENMKLLEQTAIDMLTPYRQAWGV